MSFNPQNFFLKRMGNCDFKIKYKNYSFFKPETTFGRGKDCDLTLKNIRCSLIHCKITFENGRIFIEDSSSAGTFVNNEKIIKRKVELFEGTIVGMGANPNRPEHVDQPNFYIYRVQKVEAPISLDSSDEDEDEEITESIPISRSEAVENEESQELDQNSSNEVPAIDQEDHEDSNDTIHLETNENSEDLTQKIEEHLTAAERLKLEAVDVNQIDGQVPVTPARTPQIKIEPETIDDSINRICESLKGKMLKRKLGTSTSDEVPQNSGKYPSISSTISTASTVVVPSPADLESEWISTAFVGDSVSGKEVKGQGANGQANEAYNEVKSGSLASKAAQPNNSEQEVSNLPPEPPIFAPGPSNFQPIPLHLVETASSVPQQSQQIRSVLAEAPNYLPSPNHLTQSPVNPTLSSKKKFANLALRKKILPSTSSSSTSTPPQTLNYSPISSTSNLSSSALSSISSEKLRTNSRSNSAASSASLSSSEELSKTLTPDQIKSKTALLRHYGQQTTKLIELPENPLNQTSDLLDEVEGPRETQPIFWKLGVAMVKPVRKPKTKRGRKKKSEDGDNNSGSSGSENGSTSSKSGDLTSKNDKTTKIGNITSKIANNTSKTKNVTSKNDETASETLSQSSNSSSPTKLKATARKTTSTGSAVVKRPFACVSDSRPKSDDSDSSNDYQSAQSRSSEEREPSLKKQRVDSKVGEALKLALKEQSSSKQAQEAVPRSHSIPTTNNTKKLHKFPDSDDDGSNSNKHEQPKVAPKLQQQGPKRRKTPVRRESIINLKRPSVQKKIQRQQLFQYLEANKAPIPKLGKIPQQGGQPRLRINQGTSKMVENNSPQKSHQARHASGPSTHQTSPTPNFHSKFPHLYQFDSKSNSKSPPKSPTAATKPIPMKKRRQSVFEEQAQLIPENLPLHERANAMRRWNQNTTKLIDIQTEDPDKRKRGRPKLNEDERIKMLVGRSKGNEEKK